MTPTGDGTVTVDIAAAAATDLSSNPSNAATEFTIVSDQTAPVPTITSSAGDPTGTSPIPMSVDFGETVTGFDASDLWSATATAGTPVGPGSGVLYGPGDADGGRGGDGGHGGDARPMTWRATRVRCATAVFDRLRQHRSDAGDHLNGESGSDQCGDDSDFD